MKEFIEGLLKTVDILCTKYYKLGMMETFHDFNDIYHQLSKLKSNSIFTN